jgi:hypothetical protein
MTAIWLEIIACAIAGGALTVALMIALLFADI